MIFLRYNRHMDKKLNALFSEVPPKPDYNPVRRAIDSAQQNSEVTSALRLFISMPPSTGVLANPVRHHHRIRCGETTVDLDIRSFNFRGLLFEDDIITGRADAVRVIFVGLFGRQPGESEKALLGRFIHESFTAALDEPIRKAAEFLKAFPAVPPDVVMQHWAAVRKAMNTVGAVSAARPPDALLQELIQIHMENVAVAGCASYMRGLLQSAPRCSEVELIGRTKKFIEETSGEDPFRSFLSLLVHRNLNADESRILERLGAIQIHHGSAGSNMVARYFATLHTRSVSDLFTASQMALDCGRHFGAITDMTDFVRQLERIPQS